MSIQSPIFSQCLSICLIQYLLNTTGTNTTPQGFSHMKSSRNEIWNERVWQAVLDQWHWGQWRDDVNTGHRHKNSEYSMNIAMELTAGVLDCTDHELIKHCSGLNWTVTDRRVTSTKQQTRLISAHKKHSHKVMLSRMADTARHSQLTATLLHNHPDLEHRKRNFYFLTRQETGPDWQV